MMNKRIIKDIKNGKKSLHNIGIYIEPEEQDYHKIHFILPGPEGTPFEGGLYHGMIRLNDKHPLGAPNIYMITPTGRFITDSCPIPNGSRGICTTTSAFHPEKWSPINDIETILIGFISLMCEPYVKGTVGHIKSTNEEMKRLAKNSINHIKSDDYVRNLFPDLYDSLVHTNTYKPPKMVDLPKKPTKKLKKISNHKKILDKKILAEPNNNNSAPIYKKSKTKPSNFEESLSAGTESSTFTESTIASDAGSDSEGKNKIESDSETDAGTDSETDSDIVSKTKSKKSRTNVRRY